METSNAEKLSTDDTVKLAEEAAAKLAADKAKAEQEAEILKLKTQMEEILKKYGKLTLVPLKGPTPLAKGFRNQTVVLPVTILQNKIEEIEENVLAQSKRIQTYVTEQMQSIFQYLGRSSETIQTLSTTVEALTELSGATVETVEAKVAEIEARKEKEAEEKRDKIQNLEVVTRASQLGDTVKINSVGKIDGKEFKAGRVENHQLKLGSNSFIPGFEDQLVGKTAGEIVDVNVTFPADYGNKELAGKAAVFTTNILVVKATIATATELAVKTEETKS